LAAFHRAHQAVYFDRLLAHGHEAKNWGYWRQYTPTDKAKYLLVYRAKGEYVLKTTGGRFWSTSTSNIRSIVQQIDGAQRH